MRSILVGGTEVTSWNILSLLDIVIIWWCSTLYLTVMIVQVCTEMGVEAPVSVSMKLGDIGNLFRRIVDTAQRPHLSIPETEQGRTHKHYKRLIQRSLTVAAGKLKSDGRLNS